MAVNNLRTIVTVDGAEVARGKLASLGVTMKGLLATLGLTYAATKLVSTGFKLITQSAAAAEKQGIALKAVNNILQSTGKAAEISMGQITRMATEMQRLSNFGDEKIMQEATLSLLRFNTVTADVLPRAQQLVVNMAAETGDLANQAKTLGIALDDPIMGLSRLRRSSVMVSDEQERLVRYFVETGKHAKAQGVLMDALEGKYRGNAQSMISYTQQLKNTWGDYLEFLGTETQPVLDGVKKGIDIFFMNLLDNQASSLDGMSQNAFNSMKDIARTVSAFMRTAQLGLTIYGGVITTIVSGVVGGIEAMVSSTAVTVKKLFPKVLEGIDAAVYSFMNIDITALREFFEGVGDDETLTEVLDPAQKYIESITQTARNWSSAFTNFENDIENMQRMVTNLRRTTGTGIAGLANDEAQALQKTVDDLDANLEKLNAFYDAKKDLLGYDERMIAEYYERVRFLDANYYEWKANQIAKEVSNMTKLSDAQRIILQDMLLAQLEADRLAAESTDAVIEKTVEMQDTLIDMGATLQNTFENVIASGIQNLLSNTESFAESMKNIWKSMVSSIIADISRMLAKMAALAVFQQLLGGGSGLIGLTTGADQLGINNMVGATLGGDLLSTGSGNSMGAYRPDVTTGSFNRFDNALQRIEKMVNANRPIVYTQVIEGVPFDNAVKRAALQANTL